MTLTARRAEMAEIIRTAPAHREGTQWLNDRKAALAQMDSQLNVEAELLFGADSREELDALVAKHTAFESVADFGRTGIGYFPSIRCNSYGNRRTQKNLAIRYELTRIADAYDRFMRELGDNRRAFRG